MLAAPGTRVSAGGGGARHRTRGQVGAAPSPPCVAAQSQWPSSDTTTASSDDSPKLPPCGGSGSSLCGEGEEEDDRTTVMMRNSPDAYYRKRMLALLDAEGFHGEYNFLYLSVDFETATNTGFAFVNLTSRAAARRFFAHFHRFSRWGVRTRKLCNVSWAWDDQQGITANVERYRNSSVMHASVADEHKPLLLSDGAPRPFPKPRKRLWAPRTGAGVARR